MLFDWICSLTCLSLAIDTAVLLISDRAYPARCTSLYYYSFTIFKHHTVGTSVSVRQTISVCHSTSVRHTISSLSIETPVQCEDDGGGPHDSLADQDIANELRHGVIIEALCRFRSPLYHGRRRGRS